MKDISLRFKGAMLLSFIVAFTLSILPLREEWLLLRPEWVALTLIHWGLFLPKKASLLLAWVVGLLVDAIHGSIIGQHAFGYIILLLMTLRMRPRLLADSFFHQMFLIFLTLGTYLLVNLWILGVTGNSPSGWGYWLTVLTSMLAWPLYTRFLRIFYAKSKGPHF